MNLYSEEDNLLRRYLLNDVTPEERRQVEERLLSEEINENGANGDEDLDYVDRLLLCEDELIDDYARGAMSASEQELFDQTFMLSPTRREKLLIAQAAVTYATANQASAATHASEEIELIETSQNISPVPRPTGASQNERRGREWWQTLFAPKWKIAVYIVLVLGIGFGIWRMNSSESDVVVATKVMSQAYRVQRPLETRITGFDYAPFPKTMGNDQDRADYVALDRAERILLDAVAEHPTIEAQHALGRLYLARKKFDQAEKLFNTALQSDPNNAPLHGDLGAALFERWDREHSSGQIAESEELKRQSLEHLEKALALDGSLREARFNLAILYQASNQTQLARAEWEKYLAIEPDSRARKEAERNLELLK